MRNTIPVTLLLLFLISIKSYSGPRFISNLRLSNSVTCYNSSVELMVSVADADYYSFQIQSSTGEWGDVKFGNPLLVSGDLKLLLNNLTWSANYRVELKNTSTNETVYSNIVFVNFQRPMIDNQPQNAQNCNGLDAYFYTKASGNTLLSYQWQISTNGGSSFTNLSNNSNYSGVSTNSLRVIGLINSDHQDIFRCKVSDQQGCTNETAIAELFVNQLTSTVSPTLSTTFCAGERATFELSGIVGVPEKINWFLRLSGSSNFIQITDTSKYEGLNASRLTVRTIESNQNSYKADVYFKTTNFDKDGNLVIGECLKSATRANYVIYSRPESNFSVKDSFSCNPGMVLLKSFPQTNTYYWYSDTLNAQLSINSGNFLSPFLEATKTFYVRRSDARNCKSYAKAVVANIFPKPKFLILENFEICTKENRIELEINDLNTEFNFVNVLSGMKPLSGFVNLQNGVYNKNTLFNVELPDNKLAGEYDFLFFVQNSNTTCNSDTSIFNLKVEPPPIITNFLTDETRCEESLLSLSINAFGKEPLQYIWRKNGTILSSQNTVTLKFDSLKLSDHGNYDCIIINQCGSDTSNLMKLHINPKLKIISQPTDTEVCEGKSTVLSIQAIGEAEISYQWFRNNQAIGENASSLSLENLSLLNNNSTYFCKLKSNCGVELISDTIILKVNPKPEIPNSIERKSYCQNDQSEVLIGKGTGVNTLLWYENSLVSQPLLEAPIPKTETAGLQKIFLSQIDQFGCESVPLEINVIVNTPIQTNLSSDFSAVCSTGTLNTKAKLSVTVNGGDSTNVYKWFKDDIAIFNTNSDYINTEKGGQFRVEVTNAACKREAFIEINKLSEELNKGIQSSDYLVCKNGTAYLFAEGEFNSGRFTWWENDTISNFLSDVNPYQINNIENSRIIFVSYVKKFGELSCESDRKKVEISVQSPIKINANVVNESCSNASDGKIEVLLENQIGSVYYKLNDKDFVTSNVFENLKANLYRIEVVDSLSCTAVKEIELPLNLEPKFIVQPISQTKCKGNTVNFSVSAQNYDSIKWQKKIGEGQFQDIPIENSTNLRITNIGSATNPHLTKYRAVISNLKCEIFSDEVQLLVNSFTNTLQSQTVCNGSESIFSSPGILGIPNSFQWQKRIGSSGSFLDLSTETRNNLILREVSEGDDNTFYKCKVQFLNPDNSTCLLTSDDAKLTVVSPSRVQLNKDTSICISNSVTLNATFCNGTVRWSNTIIGPSITIKPLENISYSAQCEIGNCVSKYTDTVNVYVLGKDIQVPIIQGGSNHLCNSDSIILSINNCSQNILWNTGDTLPSIKVFPSQTTKYTAICNDQFCSSSKSEEFLVTVPQPLMGGLISTYNLTQCAGFNPSEILEMSSSSGGSNPYSYIWQNSENCFSESPIWIDMNNTNSKTFNPNALFTSTCFRRKTLDSCSKIEISNIAYFNIIEDPKIEIRASNSVYCPGNKLYVFPLITGGVGICQKIWQVNKVSASASSSLWENFEIDKDSLSLENLEILFPDNLNVYFRLKYDCENTNCNLAHSNILQISIKQLPKVEILYSHDSICKGQSMFLEAKNCNGEISWNDVMNTAKITIQPNSDSLFVVKCKTDCGIAIDSLQIYVSDSLGLPTNTTPATSTMSSRVQFAAAGTGLKWFRSPTQEIGEDEPYEITSIGEHIIYVSQSNSSCTGPRLRIATTVYPDLGIVSQPQNFNNCKGNGAKMGVEAVGAGQIQYQWYRKRPSDSEFVKLTNEMSGISNANTKELSITSIGNANNPDSTEYKCEVRDSLGIMFSEVGRLEVNYLNGNLPDFISCVGNELSIDANDYFKIKGTINSVQWQINPNNEWLDLSDSLNIIGSQSLNLRFQNIQESNSSKYRIRINFDSETGTCIENSDETQVSTISTNPSSVVEIAYQTNSICRGQSLSLNATKCVGKVYWNDQELGNSILLKPKNDTLIIATCEETCVSTYDSLQIYVSDSLSLPISTTPATSTMSSIGQFVAIGTGLKWFRSPTQEIGEDEPYDIISTGEHIIYVSQSNSSCTGPRLRIATLVYPDLGIVSQPQNFTNCKGNGAKMNVEAVGAGQILYQWYRKRPSDAEFVKLTNEMSGISNANTKGLSISSIGNSNNPDSTEYKCEVRDSLGIIFSEVGLLEVNYLEGNLPDLRVCVGSDLSIDASAYFKIKGTINSVQWQINPNTGWVDLTDSPNIIGSQSLNLRFQNIQESNSSKYRIRINFDSETGICIENSDETQVSTTSTNPSSVVEIAYQTNSICRGQSLSLSATKCLGKVYWNNQELGNLILLKPKNDTLIIATCEETCVSTYDSLQIYVSDSLGLPTNTTPATSIISSIGQFAAAGTGLKWFRSPTQEIGEDEPYEITSTGEHIIYVSQSNSSCTGPRLRIATLVYPDLGIVSQPLNFTNCKGNGAKMNVEAVGAGQILYQWYRKRPSDVEFVKLTNEMSGIRNANTKELSITSIGNANSPDSTEFKCEVRDSLGIMFSEAGRLDVNYLEGNLPDFISCVGNELSIDANDYFKIKGTINSVQWQINPNNEWLDLSDSLNIIGSQSLNLRFQNIQESNSSKYRIRINFDSETGTCIESSDQSLVSIQEYPKTPEAFEIEYCQFEKASKITFKVDFGNIGLWYLTNDKNESPLKSVPTPATDKPGDFIYYLAQMNKSNCISPRQQILVRINSEPSLPISLMKNEYFDGGLITFAAEGSNLKWYATKTTKAFATEAPQFFKVGNAQYYVTQTNNYGCESERLLIKTSIINKLGFTSDLENQSDCDGNSVAFSIKTKNSIPFEISWYKRLKGKNEFELIPNQKSKTLAISNIGNLDFPDSTEIKCIIKDSLFTLTSNTALIFVNKVLGKINDLNVCDNGRDLIKFEDFKVIGNVDNYVLQSKIGNSYSDLISNFDGSSTLINSVKSGTYRLKVNYGSNSNITCTRSSNDFKLKINEHPPKMESSGFDLCQSNSLSDIKFDNPTSNTFHWFEDTNKDELKSIKTKSPGNYQLFLIQKDKNSCASEPSIQNVNILKTPILNLSDTTYTFCMFDNSIKNVFSNDLQYLDAKGDLFDKNSFSIENLGEYNFIVFKTDSNFCESNKIGIQLNIVPCYLSSREDLKCEQLNFRKLGSNKGVFFNSESKIAAETISKIDTQSKLFISNSINIDLLKPYFFFDFKNKAQIDLKLNSDFFEESSLPQRVFLNKYSGKNSDCQSNNNDNFIDGEAWQLSEPIELNRENEFQIFNIIAEGKFELGFTSDSLFSLSKFYSQKTENNVMIKWDANYQSSPLNYLIQKSLNKTEWHTITRISIDGKNTFEYQDKFPLGGKTYYRLIYQNEFGLKKLSKTIEVDFEPTKSICRISPNPINIDKPILLHTNFLDINTVEIFDILGRQLPVNVSKIGLGIFEIKTSVKLPQGQYFVKGLDSENKVFNCKFGL